MRWNRRGFDNASRRELARRASQRCRRLWFMSIWMTSKVNDTFGHPGHLSVGVGSAKVDMRPGDDLCRFMGEFVPLFPETSVPVRDESRCRFLREFSAQTIPGRDVP